MVPRLVVRARPLDRRVVLGDVEVDRPGSQGGSERRQGGVETGGDTNVIAFPMATPVSDEPELPFAEAC